MVYLLQLMKISEYDLPKLLKSRQPTYKYGSSTYLVLVYAYAYNKALSIDDFQKLSNNAFDNKHAIKRALLMLLENKAMIQLNENYWCITAMGIQQAVELAKSQNKTSPA